MSMMRLYYIGVPVCMMAQTVLMLYGVAALKGINRKMGRKGKHDV